MTGLRWLTPDWKAPPGVRAAVSLRGGGVSQGAWSSLNLGTHVGDTLSEVMVNRDRLAKALALTASPVWLNQVHGAEVADLDKQSTGPPDADAAISRRRDRICAVLTADCLPVIFSSRDGRTVGIAHAGWRGLLAGVLQATVNAMAVEPGQLITWLGPAISAAHYEVDDGLREAFLAAAIDAPHRVQRQAAFAAGRDGHYFADLYALARVELHRAGVVDVSGGDHCTFANANDFYSYRRDGITGRFATLVWRE